VQESFDWRNCELGFYSMLDINQAFFALNIKKNDRAELHSFLGQVYPLHFN
jgi:hypothetical protein